MSSISLSVRCPDPDCNTEISVIAEIEPADTDGVDADGNRGWSCPAYVVAPDPPEQCPKCFRRFSEDELDEMRLQLDNDAEYCQPDDGREDAYYED